MAFSMRDFSILIFKSHCLIDNDTLFMYNDTFYSLQIAFITIGSIIIMHMYLCRHVHFLIYGFSIAAFRGEYDDINLNEEYFEIFR